MALRQYIEMRRVAAGSRAAKPFRLVIGRPTLLDDVLAVFA